MPIENPLKVYWNEQYLREQLGKGNNYLDIARHNKVGKSTIQRALHHFKLTSPSKPWSKQEISTLKNIYGSERRFRTYFPNRKMSSIYHKANRLGLRSHIKPRKYAIDEDFFTRWDSEMAYVLGWMFSDGNVSSDKRTFAIKLSALDSNILVKIRKALKSESPLMTLTQKLPSGKGYRKYVLLRINSYPMCEDLIALGCVPKKTHKFSIPTMPRNLLKHFVRGYFDGDGSISFNKPNIIKIRFVSGSEKFIMNLAKVFTNELGIPINNKTMKNFWQSDYYGDNARKICEWMYRDCGDFFLKRKRLRFIKHVEKRLEHA